MIIVVADSAALISLAMTNIFHLIESIEFKIPREVYNELSLMKNYKNKDGYNANNVIKNLDNWNIEVLNIKDKKRLSRLIKEPLIDKGEAESLILALENNIERLITDDLKSIKVLDKHGNGKVKIRSSILIPAILFFSGKISRKQARKAVIQIAKYREWNESLFKESLIMIDKFRE